MFSAASDRIGDPGEKVSINLGPLPPGVTEGTTSETVVTIEDVALSGSTTVSFGADIYGVSEGSSTTITVVMSPAPGSDAIIRIDDEGQDGATSADYSVVPASLTFGATETSKTFTFTATDDADNDDGESVKLTFVNLPTGVSAGTISETTVSITFNDHPTVEVSFEQSGYNVTEGSGVIVKVKLNADPEREVIIPIRRMNQGASDDDYSGVPTSVTFDSGDTEKSFTFTATQDSVDDDGESVKLSFDSSLPDGVSAGTTDETTVSITDDDVSAVEVSFEQSGYSVTEGSGVIVKVKLNADPEREVIIPIRRTNQEASDSDYRGVPTSVTFDSGDTEKSFTFTADDDADDDDGESVKLTFVNLPAGVSAGTTDEAVVSITDNDAPSSLTVNFRAGTYSVTEGSTVEVVLTLDDDPERTVIIPIDRDNQDGASDSDYSGVPTSVTFNSGDTSKSFMFSAASDRIGDPGEKVSINLGPLPPGVTEGTTSETVVTIEDVALSGSTTVSFGADIYGVSEGSSTTITVVMSPAPGSDAIIRIDDEGQDGATSADYSVVPASVTFGATETSKTFTFTAEHDTDNDDGESVKLTFVNLPTGVSAGTIPETTVSITDDDVPAVEVSFEQSGYSVTEGSGVIVKVKLNADPEREVIIPIRRMNQGASDDDYSGVPTSVTFDSGDTEKSFTFTADPGRATTTTERAWKLSFDSSLPDGVSAGTTDETTVSITDDDVSAVEVSFEHSSYTVTEGETETVRVKLNADPEREVIIPIRRMNQGASDDDYSGVPVSVVFNSGDTEQTFTFTATQDSVDDDGESVKLSFDSSLPDGVSAGTIDETTVSITDDDAPSSLTVNFKKSGYTVTEGSIEEIMLTLDDDPERTVTIPLSWSNEDGASDSDHNGVPTYVTFNAGDTSKSFEFSAVSDRVGDPGEKVSINLGSLPPGVTEGTTSETVVTIEDVALSGSTTVSFGADIYGVSEGSSTTITVVMSPAPGSDAIIRIEIEDEDGASSADYSLSATSVTFGPTETSKTFTFTANQDSVDDDGESVDLGFGPLPGRVSAGLVPKTVVSITDDDDPAVEVSFEHSSYSVTEGSGVIVKVKLNADPERTVTIPIRRTNQEASDSDYRGVPTSVTFDSGDTEKSFTFTADDDTADDDGESVKLGFGNTLPTGVSAGTIDETTVSITDDDVPAVEVSFEQSGYSVTEGSGVIVKVKLNADPEREVIIPIRRTNQGASDSDYRGVPTSVTFDSGDTEKSFTFTADDDAEDDDGESVKLGFGNTLPTGVSAGTIDEAVVSITDNDAPSSLTVNFRAGTYSVTEGSTVEVVLTLDDDPERTVIIPIDRDNQDGASDSDYSGVPTSVTFNSGDTSKSFMFSAASDRIGDPGEKVSINLGPLPPGVTEGTTSETVVTIEDVALSGSTTVSFGADIYGVSEGSSTTITVVMSPAPGSDAIIRIDDEGQDGATSADYSVVPASVTFGATHTVQTFTFTATDDADNDDGESVKLTFVNLPTGVSAGTIDETTVSITDDDVPAVEVSFEQSGYSVTEGSGVIVKVKLNADPERTVTIPIRRTNQEASDSDYRGVPTSVTFDSGDTEKSFTFTADDDTADDDGESVKLGFGNTLPTGVSAGTIDETTVSITDDDVPAVEVSFEQSGYSVSEGSGVIVKVKLNADPEREVIIPIRRTNQGASDSDYRGVPTSVTFDSGDTEKSFTFTADDDTADDDGESVKLGFGNTLPTGVSAGTIDEAVVSITDNDAPSSLTVNFRAGTYSVTEGSTVEVVLTLDDDPERTVIIPIDRDNQDGASDSDYSGVPTSVTFNSGDTSKSFMFSAASDRVGDPGEKVSINLGPLPPGVTEGTTSETVVTIEDVALSGSTTVSFGADTYGVPEGSSTTITVVMSHAPGSDATIPIDD